MDMNQPEENPKGFIFVSKSIKMRIESALDQHLMKGALLPS